MPLQNVFYIHNCIKIDDICMCWIYHIGARWRRYHPSPVAALGQAMVLYWTCTLGRPDSRFAPSQWETALLCNDVSYCLGASLESALAPVPLSIFRSNSKFDENSKHYSVKYTSPITTIFCTRHDSVTVVTCAKYRCDRSGIFKTRAFWIFIEICLVGRAPGACVDRCLSAKLQ